MVVIRSGLVSLLIPAALMAIPACQRDIPVPDPPAGNGRIPRQRAGDRACRRAVVGRGCGRAGDDE